MGRVMRPVSLFHGSRSGDGSRSERTYFENNPACNRRFPASQTIRHSSKGNTVQLKIRSAPRGLVEICTTAFFGSVPQQLR